MTSPQKQYSNTKPEIGTFLKSECKQLSPCINMKEIILRCAILTDTKE